MDDKPVMLIVDDVEINRVVLTQFFQEEYQIMEAENGQEAMEIIEGQSVNIVLVDLVMPVMDGFQVLAMMKRNDQLAGIPVVVMTANNDGDSEARAMEMGAADFITKPYNPTIVRCRIRNVMAREENEWRKVAQMAQNRQLVEMHQHVEKDSLTGIYNREAFYRKAAELMQEHHQTGYSIVYLDISCFKVVNDLFRIETGNLILKTAAFYFNVLTGDGGLCARIEADHFALCQPTEKLDMDNLIAGLDSTIQSLGISHNILFYAGVYPVENVFLPVDQMCDRAHMALNRIKGRYMTRYAFYDKAMRDQMIEEQMIVRNMEDALHEGQFVINLQHVDGGRDVEKLGMVDCKLVLAFVDGELQVQKTLFQQVFRGLWTDEFAAGREAIRQYCETQIQISPLGFFFQKDIVFRVSVSNQIGLCATRHERFLSKGKHRA